VEKKVLKLFPSVVTNRLEQGGACLVKKDESTCFALIFQSLSFIYSCFDTSTHISLDKKSSKKSYN
jgi:hypothetical protein